MADISSAAADCNFSAARSLTAAVPAVCSSADQVPADTWDAAGLVPVGMPAAAGLVPADMPVVAGSWSADMYAAAGSSVDDISAVAAAPIALDYFHCLF